MSWSCSAQWCASYTLPGLLPDVLLCLQWTQKVTLAAFAQPALSLLLASPATQKWVLRPLRRRLFNREVSTLRLDEAWAALVSQLELLLFIGPFVPIMLPLGVVSIFMSSVVLTFKCDAGYYGNAEEGAEPELVLYRPPVAYLMLGNAMLVAGAILFYVDNRLHGTWIVCILPAVGIVLAFAVWCWRQWQQHSGTPHMQHSPLRASLLGIDDGNFEVSSPLSRRGTAGDVPDNRDRAQSAVALSNIAESYDINVKRTPRRHTTVGVHEGGHSGSVRSGPESSEDFPYHRMTG